MTLLTKMNLKIRKYLLTVSLILVMIFLLHPGRFSVINVSTVTEDMLIRAKLKYTNSDITSIEKSDESQNILTQLEKEIMVNGKIQTKFTPRPDYLCKSGGNCFPNKTRKFPMVGIIVPYRDRAEQKSIFISYMHTFLQHQQLNYTILIVEQISKSNFNRAKLLNIGYKQILKLYPDCECFIFHDVDLLPVNDENHYICLDKPRHM